MWKETLVLSSDDSFYKIADILCETTVKNQLKPGGLTYHADDQCWKMEIASYEYATADRMDQELGFDGHQRPTQIVPTDSVAIWSHHDKYSHKYQSVIPCKTKVSSSILKVDSIVSFDYDETERFLKVLEVRRWP